MECKNHPGVEAIARCTGCAEPFCENCLVEIQGHKYCGSCKGLAIQDAPAVEESMVPCKEASEALTYAIIGIFCFGIILEPIALLKASKAKKLIRMNPNLTGGGKATAATIIAVIALILWILGLVARVSQF